MPPLNDPSAADDGEVRIGPVAAVPEVLREFGVLPQGPFARAGVPLQAFRNPDTRIAFEALGRLLDESAAATGCAHFGLRVGERFELHGLGAIGHLMATRPPSATRCGPCCCTCTCTTAGLCRS